MSRKPGINKMKVGFSVDIVTYEEFEKYCDDNFINKSKLIDKIMSEFLEGKKNKVILLEKEKTN